MSAPSRPGSCSAAGPRAALRDIPWVFLLQHILRACAHTDVQLEGHRASGRAGGQVPVIHQLREMRVRGKAESPTAERDHPARTGSKTWSEEQ